MLRKCKREWWNKYCWIESGSDDKSVAEMEAGVMKRKLLKSKRDWWKECWWNGSSTFYKLNFICCDELFATSCPRRIVLRHFDDELSCDELSCRLTSIMCFVQVKKFRLLAVLGQKLFLTEAVLWNFKRCKEQPGICSDESWELHHSLYLCLCVPFECNCVAQVCLPATIQHLDLYIVHYSTYLPSSPYLPSIDNRPTASRPYI